MTPAADVSGLLSLAEPVPTPNIFLPLSTLFLGGLSYYSFWSANGLSTINEFYFFLYASARSPYGSCPLANYYNSGGIPTISTPTSFFFDFDMAFLRFSKSAFIYNLYCSRSYYLWSRSWASLSAFAACWLFCDCLFCSLFSAFLDKSFII